MRFLPAGSDALLVELADLETTLALFDTLQSDRPEGVVELVPAARTLLLRFDPLITDRTRLIAAMAHVDLSAHRIRQGQSFEIPVIYDGEDLAEVAAMFGWSVAELIQRHSAATYTVGFTGFAPGFAYMTCDDPALEVPRRQSPRQRIPAGSVALGGKFSGIYPTDSPGGWQLLGRTPLAMWDTTRARAALLAPGDQVRFRQISPQSPLPEAQTPAAKPAAPSNAKSSSGLRVTQADRPALFQDNGRPGQAGQGVAESGALDRTSLSEANLCVGNPRGAAVLEISYGGFALRPDRPVTLAVTGAPAPLTIQTGDGRRLAAPLGHPFALDAGDELTLGFPAEGTRSYLAIRGGFAVETVLGSAATDTLAKVGPAPIGVGDVLIPADLPVGAVDPYRPAAPRLPRAGETVTLDILLGPRADWFTASALSTLLTQEWQVTTASSRVGMRLAGPVALERSLAAELPSEGTPLGAIQVPHSGQPVVFLADHPLTGGYPVIAVVAAHHLALAGQTPIGAKLRFNAIAGFDPLVRDTDR